MAAGWLSTKVAIEKNYIIGVLSLVNLPCPSIITLQRIGFLVFYVM